MNSTATVLCSFLLWSTLAACGTVAETGRIQLKLFNEEQMTQMGLEGYAEACKDYRIITGTPEAQMVERVGRKIAAASGRDYAWEFRLLDAPKTINAFCLPGGKVAVYSGLLQVTQNEDALAAVMGHEVAHATSGHGNERVSQGQASELLISGAGAFVGLTGLSTELKDTVMKGINAGVSLGVLMPYSRSHESEADEIGLLFLIRAGYDPNEAPRLWERMAELGGESGDALSQFIGSFLSTHPAPLDRAKRLRELIPVMQQRVAKERAAKQ
ncbi:MAG: M48 family metallopeptidase [Planctomycetota bacterium]